MRHIVRRPPVRRTVSPVLKILEKVVWHLFHAVIRQRLPGRHRHMNRNRCIESERSKKNAALFYHWIRGFPSDNSGHTSHSRCIFECPDGACKKEKGPSVSLTLRSTYEGSPCSPPKWGWIPTYRELKNIRSEGLERYS